MDKKIYFIIFILTILCFSEVSATPTPGTLPTADDLNIPTTGIENANRLLGILESAVGIVWKVFFIVAVLFIVIAAFNYLTASGNEEKIKTAHKQLTWAAVAVVVALLSVSFSVIIQNFIMNKESQNVGDIYNGEYGALPAPGTKWQYYKIPSQTQEKSGGLTNPSSQGNTSGIHTETNRGLPEVQNVGP